MRREMSRQDAEELQSILRRLAVLLDCNHPSFTVGEACDRSGGYIRYPLDRCATVRLGGIVQGVNVKTDA